MPPSHPSSHPSAARSAHPPSGAAPLAFPSGHAVTVPYLQRAAYAAAQVHAAVAFLELVDAEDAATQLLRARFEQARAARVDVVAWEALHVAADQLVAAWNPYLTRGGDPYAAALFAALRRA